MLRILLCLACAVVVVPADVAAAADGDSFAGRFAVNVVMNGDFELPVDTTVTPAKYGAYWKDAFEYAAKTTACQIDEIAPGQHVLRLDPGHTFLRQAVTLYGPYADRFVLTFRMKRTTPAAIGHLLVKSGMDHALHYVLGDSDADPPGEHVAMQRGPAGAADADGFIPYRIDVAGDLLRRARARPSVWLEIQFGAEGGTVQVDDVIGMHWLPRVAPHELRAMLLEEVRDLLRLYFAPRDGNGLHGLGLVDPVTGYQVVSRYDCMSGKATTMEFAVGIAGIHEIALRYCRCHDESKDAPALLALVKTTLRNHLESILAHNVYEPTHLYTFVDPNTLEPKLDLAVAPSHFIHHALDVAALFEDDVSLQQRVRARVLAMADALVELRAAHDLPHTVQYARGAGGNWFGRMPEKIHPDGRLDQPKQYNQSWAISQNRSWYYDFQTCHGLMRAWSIEPKPEYLQTALRAIDLFDRKFDASRFDLENDTDDHYGFNVESLLKAYDASGKQATPFLELAQKFTDFRLPRDAAWDKNLWIEGVRLGSFCAGDQPRAYRGPTSLYSMSKAANPETARYAPYLFAVRELAKGDMKHRLLDDGYTQDASGFMWTMISACYKSDFIGPCSMGLDWEGDMGDLFAGPSSNGFRALARAIEIGGGGVTEFTAWYATLFDHTMSQFRKPYGYRYGMSVDTGKRYGIPERYLEGFSNDNPYGIGCVLVHAELIDGGALDRAAARFDAVHATRADDGSVLVRMRGPAGAKVVVRAADHESIAQLGVVDWRLRLVGDPAAVHGSATLDGAGLASIPLALPAHGRVIVEAELDVGTPLLADLLAIEQIFD